MTDKLTVIRESSKPDVFEAPQIAVTITESDGLSVTCFKPIPNSKDVQVFKRSEYRFNEWKKFDLETIEE